MANGPIFPEKEENPHFKQPEFILIDDRQEKRQSTHFDSHAHRIEHPHQNQNESEEPTFTKSTLSLRILCLLSFFFCLVFGLGLILWTSILTLLAALSLFQNHSLNEGVRSFWRLCCHALIVGLGLALGVISPTLGLGLIALYFSLTSQVIDNSILQKILKRSFNEL